MAKKKARPKGLMVARVVKKKKKRKKLKKVLPNGLSRKQQTYVDNYFQVGMNGERAAALAGYGAPHVASSRLLRSATVGAVIAERLERIKKASEKRADVLCDFLWECIHTTIVDAVEITQDGFKMKDLSKCPRCVQIMVKSCKLTHSKFGDNWGISMHDFSKVVELWARLKGILPNDREGGGQVEVIREIIEKTVNGNRDKIAGIPASAH